jgi:hypothetical protein
MSNLPALLSNASPLVSRFFAKMSKNHQFKTTVCGVNLEKSFRFQQSLRTFPVIVSNNYPRISGKMGFTIEDKALIINN